jgi:hypothetical protein
MYNNIGPKDTASPFTTRVVNNSPVTTVGTKPTRANSVIHSFDDLLTFWFHVTQKLNP